MFIIYILMYHNGMNYSKKESSYVNNSLYTRALTFVKDPIVLWNYIFMKSVKHNNLL